MQAIMKKKLSYIKPEIEILPFSCRLRILNDSRGVANGSHEEASGGDGIQLVKYTQPDYSIYDEREDNFHYQEP